MTPLRPIARRALAAQSDERLVRLLREGHAPAFEEIVRRHRDPLVAFATAIVSHSRAEDVVQSSLEKAHKALTADDRVINLRPWLFTIVRNGALNVIRGEPITDELGTSTATVPGPSEVAERNEELDRLVVAICALPAAQRQALVKREFEGVGHGEIAAQLGTTATAVRGLIFRARTSVRNAVGAMVPLPLLRVLLGQGPAAAGIAGGSAGTGAALVGGAGAKGATAIAAAIVALGTGIAIDHGHRTAEEKRASAEASRQAASDASRVASATAAGPASAASGEPAGANSHDGSAPARSSAGGSEDSSGGDVAGGTGQVSGGSDGGSSGSSGSSGTSGNSGNSGSGHEGSSPSGTGGGHEGPGSSAPAEDPSGHEGSETDPSGHEGPDPSGSEPTGTSPAPEPPEESSSGPGPSGSQEQAEEGSGFDDPVEDDGGGSGPH